MRLEASRANKAIGVSGEWSEQENRESMDERVKGKLTKSRGRHTKTEYGILTGRRETLGRGLDCFTTRLQRSALSLTGPRGDQGGH